MSKRRRKETPERGREIDGNVKTRRMRSIQFRISGHGRPAEPGKLGHMRGVRFSCTVRVGAGRQAGRTGGELRGRIAEREAFFDTAAQEIDHLIAFEPGGLRLHENLLDLLAHAWLGNDRHGPLLGRYLERFSGGLLPGARENIQVANESTEAIQIIHRKTMIGGSGEICHWTHFGTGETGGTEGARESQSVSSSGLLVLVRSRRPSRTRCLA